MNGGLGIRNVFNRTLSAPLRLVPARVGRLRYNGAAPARVRLNPHRHDNKDTTAITVRLINTHAAVRINQC